VLLLFEDRLFVGCAWKLCSSKVRDERDDGWNYFAGGSFSLL